MNILFIHQNFPGQFKHLAPALVSDKNRVVAMTMQKSEATTWLGIEIVSYQSTRGSSKDIHPWIIDFETKIIRGEACLKAALKMHAAGFIPDIIIAHHGWGESLFLKNVWPRSKLGIYSEFYYHAEGADSGFDSEFMAKDVISDTSRLRLKNINNLLHFDVADSAISPTYWQASTFPEPFRNKITVIHDGIDTNAIQPNSDAFLKIKNRNGQELHLSRKDELITFVNRNLEPYRGYHIFMRSLPEILKSRPNARVLIVGGHDVSYGSRPSIDKHGNSNWKDIFISEVRGQLSDDEWSRIHFLGYVSYQCFITLIQLSSVHVYLTYPFVLSWSLLEAMSAGCAIVASDTKPLHEAITHDQTGKLVDFFDHKALAEQVCDLLDNPKERKKLGEKARRFAQQHYDLHSICLPRQLVWVEELASK